MSTFTLQSKELEITLLEGEKIWSGAIKEGHKMPFSDAYKFDFYANNMYNQLQPLLISNKGLYVWSEEPYRFEIKGNKLIITDEYNAVQTGRKGTTLAETRKYVSETFFPPSGKMPDSLLFSAPQYNTWIELTYWHNQEDILKYAKAIIDNGFPPGVFMIDDTWQEDYGLWVFHPGRFPSPKKMVDELHKMGFKVMLWMVPFVSADQYLICRELKSKKALLLEKQNENDTWETAQHPAMIRWWNGVSAMLDFSNPEAVNWFNEQLDRLVEDYGIDGFKLDAGDMDFYPANTLSKENLTPNEQSRLYTQFGLRFPLNEYRACWKMAGQPIAQRLHDKNHSWEDLQKLVPHMLTEGMVGYTFSCPDMIGGGDFASFLDLNSYDEELVVRSAQCHALMPMMQFSVAPWRILNEQNLGIIKDMVKLRQKFTPLIIELTENSSKTGEPIISNLEYYFPNQNLENVNNQFMLGKNVLIAPMAEKGYSRTVHLPKGEWKADDGKKYKGGKAIQIEVPLNRLPYFMKL
jgi:alpha-glucosidase